MDAAQLEARLRAGEDSATEFKSVVRSQFKADPHDLARAVAAFANSCGGQVFLGVEDDGTVSGVGNPQQADELMRQVLDVCRTGVEPAVYCRITKLEYRGAVVLVVDVPGFSTDRPYHAGTAYFMREGNRVRPASRDELLRLVQSGDVYFDEQPVAGATVDDIALEAVREFLDRHYDRGAAEEAKLYLERLGCVDRDGTPTVAGIVFFGKEPTRWLVDARTSLVLFPGTEATGEFADRKELTGPLSVQVEGAMSFLELHVRAPSRLVKWSRTELGIPPEVLREAVINAAAHRDYRTASQTRIFVFEDRVEVINPGILLNQLNLDNIKMVGTSQRRNPRIAALLMRTVRRESIGIGIPEMIRLMRERNLPEPEFSLDAGHFRVVLRDTPVSG